MELTPSSGKAFTNAGQTMGYRISNENAGFIMDILATKLYTDPMMAPPREIITNAFDAHLMSDKKDVPVRITPPHPKDLNFRVRDFGPGLSPDQMESFFSFGDSNKRHSNEATGGFGIGSKSPFAIADSFTTNVFHDGTLYIWQSFKKDGRPHSACLLTTPTTEPSGLEVIVPISDKNVALFNSKLSDFLSHVQSPYELTSTLLSLSKAEPVLTSADGTHVLYGKRVTDGSHRTGIMVRMGDILYKLPSSMHTYGSITATSYGSLLTPQEKNWFNHLNSQFNLFYYDMPIGSLAISPNREEIIDSAKNRAAVKQHAANVLDAALTYRWKQHISHIVSKTEIFLHHAYNNLHYASNGGTITEYIFSKIQIDYPHLKIEDHLVFPDSRKTWAPISNRDSFILAVMKHPDFIKDTGLIYSKVENGKNTFVTPTSDEIVHNYFFRYSALKYKDTFLSTLKQEEREQFYQTCFGVAPPPNTSFLVPQIAPGRYCPDGNCKNLTGHYFVTKPLSEIKNPFYRWIVASCFITPPTKARVTPASAPAKKALVVADAEDPSAFYAWSDSTLTWERVPYGPRQPIPLAVVFNYTTGPSYVYSQDPYLKQLVEYERPNPISVNQIRSILQQVAHYGRANLTFVAIKEGQTVPADYAKTIISIRDLLLYASLVAERHYTSVPDFISDNVFKAVNVYTFREILPPRDHDYCCWRLSIFLEEAKGGKTKFAFPVKAKPFESAMCTNSREYEYRVTPIDPGNQKLLEHLNTFYPYFFTHYQSDRSWSSDDWQIIFLKSVSKDYTLPAAFAPGLHNNAESPKALFYRYFPYLVYHYYDLDITKPFELSPDLLKRYSEDVINPLLAALLYRLEKR